MKKLIILLSAFILSLSASFAQSASYAKFIIDTLGSKYFAGRGYCIGQDKLAANFLAKQFNLLHLRPLGTNSYFQFFPVSKNCILDSVKLYINNKYLKLDSDYIIEGNTPSISGTFKIKFVKNPKHFRRLYKLKHKDSTFIIVSYKKIRKYKHWQKIYKAYRFNQMEAAGIIILKNKFYYYPTSSQAFYPLIFLKPSSLPHKPKKLSISVHAKMNVNFQTQNIIAYIPGKIDSFIVFSAHYDHLGILGQVYFPGANDNASGVAMVLSLAKHFANRKTPPKYNLAFILFSGEELGLLGSLYFVTHPTFDLNKIKLLVNLDMVGSGDQGITVVNAFNQKKAFQLLKQINSQLHLLPSVKPRKNAPDSDHYPFTLKKIPAIFIYTRGRYKQYHSIYDRPDSLYYDYFPKLEKLLYTFTEKY